MLTTTSYHAVQDVHVATSTKGHPDRVSTAVYSTRDYSQFKLNELNRPIDPKKLVKLYDAVEKRNLLADHPIMVALDFSVLDGQHRLKVAEALESPIYYFFASDTTISDIPALQARRAGWKATDYIGAYSHADNENYIRLAEFIKRYSWMPVHFAVNVCHYGDKSAMTEDFTAGRYKCNDVGFAIKVAEALLDFRRAGFSHWNTRVFHHAVVQLLVNADYDHGRMLDKLRYNSVKLRPAVSTDDYFIMFNQLYNNRSGGAKKCELRKLTSADPKYRVDKKAEKAAQAE